MEYELNLPDKRNGKIAHLPHQIQLELNQRLERGDDTQDILDWLNSEPDVLAVLEDFFREVPISKQNLHQWRKGGFREYQLRMEFIGHAHILRNSDEDFQSCLETQNLAGALARKLVTHYAALLNTWDGEPDTALEAKLTFLRPLLRDIALLQKSVHLAADRAKVVEQELEFKKGEKNRRFIQRFENLQQGRIYYDMMVEKLGGDDRARDIANSLAKARYNIEEFDFTPDGVKSVESDPDEDAEEDTSSAPETPQASQTPSNPVKPLPVKPVAPVIVPFPASPAPPNGQPRSNLNLNPAAAPNGQTRSNPVKPLAAAIS